MTSGRYSEFEVVAACPVCGDGRQTTFDETASVRRCVACGFRFVSPRPTQAEVALGYSLPGSYASWQRESLERERLWRRRFEAVLGGSEPGRLLDIGAGLGTFLSIARTAGWTVEGTEVSEVAIAHCRGAYGIELVAGELEPDSVVGPFDAITMWHVIEHLPAPLSTLRTCRSLLRPDGLLILGLPNDATAAQALSAIVRLTRRLLRRAVEPRYETLRPGVESHLSHFTPRTIARALADSGFDVVNLGIDDAIPSRSAPGRLVFAGRRLLTAITPWNFGTEMLVVARSTHFDPGS